MKRLLQAWLDTSQRFIELSTRDHAKPAGVTVAHPQWLLNKLHQNALKRVADDVRGHVLDVGCGDKPWHHLFPDVKTYTGLDYLGPSATQNAITVADVCADAASMPFRDGSFDRVVAFQSLEHIKLPETALHEIYRVLRPGGKIVLTVPFLYHVHDAEDDFWRWTEHGLTQVLKENGFESVAISPIGGAYAMIVTAAGVHTFYEVGGYGLDPSRLRKVWSVIWRSVGRPGLLGLYVLLNGLGAIYYGSRHAHRSKTTSPTMYVAVAQVPENKHARKRGTP